MKKRLFLFFALFLWTTCIPRIIFCETMKGKLEMLFEEYQKVKNASSVKSFVEFHFKVRAFVDSARESSEKLPLPEKYNDLGIFYEHYNDGLCYSGKFLKEAHNLNPHSEWREKTLYITIMDEESFAGDSPDLTQAFLYIKEFPKGFYAGKVYRIIAQYYDDLFKVLTQLEDKKNGDLQDEVYKYDEYRFSINNTNIRGQLVQAQVLGIIFYEKALAFSQPNTETYKGLKEQLNNLKKGQSCNWYYGGC